MGVFSLRLSEEAHDKLRFICEKQSRSQNKQVEFIIHQYIADYEKVNGPIELEKTENLPKDYRTQSVMKKR